MANRIVEMTLVTADSEVLHLSATSNPQLFEFARVSLGLFGILLEVTLQALPEIFLEKASFSLPAEDLPGRVAKLLEEEEEDRVLWFLDPAEQIGKIFTRRVVVVAPADESGTDGGGIGGAWAEHGSGCSAHNPCRDTAYKALAFPPGAFSHKQTESEFFVPEGDAFALAFTFASWLRTTRRLADSQPRPGLMLLGRYVAADDIPLSPAFQRASVALTLIMRHRPDGGEDGAGEDGADVAFFARVLEKFQALCLSKGGRPHWAKRHTCGAAELASVYPRYAKFVAMRARLDPGGMFVSSPHLRQLFVPDTTIDGAR